jgi:hypothetical protein
VSVSARRPEKEAFLSPQGSLLFSSVSLASARKVTHEGRKESRSEGLSRESNRWPIPMVLEIHYRCTNQYFLGSALLVMLLDAYGTLGHEQKVRRGEA